MKICSVCKRSDVLFDVDKSRADGLAYVCRKCKAAYTKTPEYLEKRRKRHQKNPAISMLMAARNRAKETGLVFNLTLSDIVIPEKCPILGIELKVSLDKNGPRPDSPSLDRIDSSLGYIKGNIAVVSHRANRIKNDATPQELLQVAMYAHPLPPYIPTYDNFVAGQTQVLYSGPYFDEKELGAAVKALWTGKWLTSGEYVARFQNEFSRIFGVKYSHMVNSGSSANLVMIAAVKKRLGWGEGDEVIVSPVGFPTTVAPLVQNGLKPVFVDIEMQTLNFDIYKIREKITPRTRAIFISPVLGNPPDMDILRELCDEFGLSIIGDNCDSLGTKWNGNHISDYYFAWSSSTYPAHHITVGQGGMVSSNDKQLINLVRSFSIWGRDCYCVGAANMLPCGTCGKRFSNWLGGDDVIDHKYVFTQMGYNLAPALDMQGAIGLEQLKKFSHIDQKRKANYAAIAKYFSGVSGVRVADRLIQSDPCPFGVPIICDNSEIKESLVSYLEAHKIQTRQYFAGNLLRHPAYSYLDDASKYPNADRALREVFFLGCPPHYTGEVLDYIGGVVAAWTRSQS